MNKTIKFPVVLRERSGKGAARETRRNNLIPGVIYGAKQPPVTIAVEPQPLRVEMNRAGFYTSLFQVEYPGKKEMCLVRDVQKHPVTDKPLHIDFLRVDPKASIVARAPVHFENQDKSVGVKKGGVLNVVLHEIEITAPAGAIPSALVIDIAELDIGDAVHISALSLPKDVVLAGHYEADATIATIAAPTVQLETEAEAAESSDAAGA